MWWETKNAVLKTVLFVTLGIAGIALVLTFSRGGFLGALIASGLFLLWKFNAKTLTLALIAAIFVLLLAPEPVYDRITMGFDSGDMNVVSAGRIEGIWAPLLPETLKSPIWGNGIGSVMWSDPLWNGMMLLVAHAHNAYLEAVLDMGFVGLALLLAYYWQCGAASARSAPTPTSARRCGALPGWRRRARGAARHRMDRIEPATGNGVQPALDRDRHDVLDAGAQARQLTSAPGLGFAAPTARPVLAHDPNIPLAGGADVQQAILARLFAAKGNRVSMLCHDFGSRRSRASTAWRCTASSPGTPACRSCASCTRA